MKNLKYAMVINREDGRYWAWFPGIPGCVTDGDTLEELRTNAKDAVSGYLASLHAAGQEIPESIENGSLETFEIKNDPAEWEKGGVAVKPMEAV